LETRSIHYRRRWFYVLWVLLVLISGGTLYLWEKPLRVGQAKVEISLRVAEAPAGTRLQVWAGPRSRWPSGRWEGQGARVDQVLTSDHLKIPAFYLPVAYRRWVPDFIPRRTSDFLVFKFSAPGQPPRYEWLSLARDLRAGTLGPGRRMWLGIDCKWGALGVDPEAPYEVR